MAGNTHRRNLRDLSLRPDKRTASSASSQKTLAGVKTERDDGRKTLAELIKTVQTGGDDQSRQGQAKGAAAATPSTDRPQAWVERERRLREGRLYRQSMQKWHELIREVKAGYVRERDWLRKWAEKVKLKGGLVYVPGPHRFDDIFVVLKM